MRISQITVSVTKQVRQYEPVRIEVVVDVNDTDTVDGAVKFAKEEISRAFSEFGR
jgi:hypothetical protein